MTDKKDKAIFLDRDGTINVDKGYVHKKEDLEFLPNAIEGMRKMQNSGYRLIITTNQSGIGKGLYGLEEYFAFREEILKQLVIHAIFVSAEYFCQHIAEDNCDCRKPRIGMLEKAAKDFDLNLRECWVVGNSERDIVAGIVADCRTIRILRAGEKSSLILPDFTAKDMLEAAEYILNNENK